MKQASNIIYALMMLLPQQAYATDKDTAFTDTDWTLKFYSNCKLPQNTSAQWQNSDKSRFLRITLSPKDKGGCSNDNQDRNRAPYWERAELRQERNLKNNIRYQLDMDVRFVEGFTGGRETFMQLHSNYKGCGKPPIMIKINNGKLEIDSKYLDEEGKLRTFHDRNIQQITPDSHHWTHIKWQFDTRRHPQFSIWWNGKNIVKNRPYHIMSCGQPYLKFGIYRPGGDENTQKSTADFDKFSLKIID